MSDRSRVLTLRLMSTPMNSALPPVISSRPMMALMSVLLPQPDSPTTPRVSPRGTLKLTSSTAFTYSFVPKPSRLSGDESGWR
jgi:hypothetical protein